MGISVEETGTDIASWYDITQINMIYVCAKTLFDDKLNSRLVDQICTFQSGFVYNDTIVKDRNTFSAGRKFKKLKELNSGKNVHNVPFFTAGTYSELASIMADRMGLYQANEHQQEF